MARRSILALTLLALPAFACTVEGEESMNQYTSSGGTSAGDEIGSETAETGDSMSSGDGDSMESSDTNDSMDSMDSSDSMDSMDSNDSMDSSDTTTGDPPDECMTASAGSSCGAASGIKGSYAMGQSEELPLGAILNTDNGPGNGREDWYRFEFPIDANNPRPTAGTAKILLETIDGDPGDYRFEIYRDCGAEAYGQGLAAEFGSNAPPLSEWDFSDLDVGGIEQLNYLEMVPWPSSVWVRVFRVQNDGMCSNYKLTVSRQ